MDRYDESLLHLDREIGHVIDELGLRILRNGPTSHRTAALFASVRPCKSDPRLKFRRNPGRARAVDDTVPPPSGRFLTPDPGAKRAYCSAIEMLALVCFRAWMNRSRRRLSSCALTTFTLIVRVTLPVLSGIGAAIDVMPRRQRPLSIA